MSIHRKIWTSHHGSIPKGRHIHHIDGNKHNNNIDNLICVSPEMHYAIHLEQWEKYGNPRDGWAVNRLAKEINMPRVSGWKHTGEARAKMSKSNTGRDPWNKGKKGLQSHSDASLKKIRSYKRTEDQLAKMRNVYTTPLGVFAGLEAAAKANNISTSGVSCKCRHNLPGWSREVKRVKQSRI